MSEIKELRIKLAAIARDEAAYLPEWIFHHLEFGFDEIEIYINNTTDNSLDVIGAISKNYPVVANNADALFESSTNNFQPLAYKALADKAIADGFTHIMFLDIDEFWTPADFKTTIKELLHNYNYPQALCLNWFVHCAEAEFSPCYANNIKGINNGHVKTIFQLNLNWDKIDIHNVIGKEITYTRGDGSVFDFGDSTQCAITDKPKVTQDFFIIHRMFRSQMEYIALIGRGRPNKAKVKTGRNGYYVKHITDVITFDDVLLKEYYEKFEVFLKQGQLMPLIEQSRNFVRERYKTVIKWAKEASSSEVPLFVQVFQRINLSEVNSVREELIQKLELATLDVKTLTKPSYSYLLFLFLGKLLIQIGFDRVAHKILFKASKELPNVDAVQLASSIENALPKTDYPKAKYADLYRELAIYWYKQNQPVLAGIFITKARELRPKGPYIIRLYNEIMEERSKATINAGKHD